MRFQDLIHQIDTQNSDSQCEQGKWIQAVKHSKEYDSINPTHTDSKGWKWWNEIEEHYKNGDILIFKIGKYNWFVLPEFDEEFLTTYPKARLK